MKYTEHGLLKHSKVGSLINFQSLNLHWSVLLDQIPLQLEREGIKEREDDERGGWHCSRESFIKIFPSKGGNYSREVINRGTAIIQWYSIYLVDSWFTPCKCLFYDNRPFAWWRHFTTTTRILRVFPFLCKLSPLLFKPHWDYHI